uniref:TF-B3 domain-containing protein n=1 Tax=Syphacia muris TaxID=451379 RepID=A0A0N5AH43_9BILA
MGPEKLNVEHHLYSGDLASNLIRNIKIAVITQLQTFMSSYATPYYQESFASKDKSSTTSNYTAHMAVFTPMNMFYGVMMPVPVPYLLTQQFRTSDGMFYILPLSNARRNSARYYKTINEEGTCIGKRKFTAGDELCDERHKWRELCNIGKKVEDLNDIRKGDKLSFYRTSEISRSSRTTFKRLGRQRQQETMYKEIKHEKMEVVLYVKRARDQDGRVLYTSDESSSDTEEEAENSFS